MLLCPVAPVAPGFPTKPAAPVVIKQHCRVTQEMIITLIRLKLEKLSFMIKTKNGRSQNSWWSKNSWFMNIRKRFLLGRLQTWVGSLKTTNLPYSRCHIFVSCRNNVGINSTLRQHTVLDSCRHQYGWPWMTLNARFVLKCVNGPCLLDYLILELILLVVFA